ncbi:hypothetical protein Vadar_013902 [Vaccinium darrowii]|uniref:Uncharacterized protein n=1 Tax=Vaccinium darrowii TaxID=229202 RepID=A0ACB7Y6F4_9ERIC|nr:hypothetical protein Vadar_013902 [Vaccinium darrowii]
MALFSDHLIEGRQILSIGYEGDESVTQVDVLVYDPAIGALSPRWRLSDDSSHPEEWYSESTKELFDQEKSVTISATALLLRSSLHRKDNSSEHFLLLGDRIVNGDAKWGSSTPQFGEISFIGGYWEWLEDVLARNKGTLTDAKIYDAVFASLFTYDRNTNLIRSFCEHWCPSTNSLHIPIGEVSISLWDMRLIGGLSADGTFYDEVVPSARELNGSDKRGEPLLPSSCKYLFLAYHQIYCASGTSNVTTHEWVKFWFKAPSRYKEPPHRVQKKRSGEPRTSNNPTGFISAPNPRSRDGEKVFDDLGIEKNMREETNLAAFLSCWLCVFVLPNKEVGQIRPGVFKVASMMARGERFSLAVPVLASIYHGLREITSSPSPSKCGATFPIHYLYGWLGQYYDSYFLPSSLKFKCSALMVRLAGEKKAKHFTAQEACDLLKSISPSKLSVLALNKPKQLTICDNGVQLDSWSNYLISLRSSFLTLRRGGERIIEPYSPHRFARQFQYCQDIPGKLKEELSTGSLEKIFQLWKSCTRLGTNAEFTIPLQTSKGLATKQYVEWWNKSSSQFCKDKLPSAKMNSPRGTPKGNHIITIRSAKSKMAKDITPPHSKPKEKEPRKATTQEGPKGESKKRIDIATSEESSSDKGERHWKRLKKAKVTVSDLQNLNFDLEGVLDDLPDTSNHLEVLGERLGNQFASDDSLGSVDGPNSFDLLSKQKAFADETSCQVAIEEAPSKFAMPMKELRQSLAKSLGPAPSMVTVFRGEDVISECQRAYVSTLWTKLAYKIGKQSFDRLNTIEDEAKKLFEEMRKVDAMDISPLERIIESFFKNIRAYNSARSASTEVHKDTRARQLADASQRLSQAEFNESEQVKMTQLHQCEFETLEAKEAQLKKELESICIKRKEMEELLVSDEEKLSKLQVDVSSLKDEISTIENVAAQSDEDTQKLEKMKTYIEASQKELADFKLF